MTNDNNRRTRLPEEPAEGAGNFGAEPAEDPTNDNRGFAENVEVRSEEGTLGQPERETAESDVGELTGGETPEEIAERESTNDREAEELEEEYETPTDEPEDERADRQM